MGVKELSARWLKARRALKKEDQVLGQKLVEMSSCTLARDFMLLMILWRRRFSRCSLS
jgi:hypothetical protein